MATAWRKSLVRVSSHPKYQLPLLSVNVAAEQRVLVCLKARGLKAFCRAQEKLRLDVDEETAVGWMQQLINESSSALMPAIMEQGHRFAQYWR